jgi:cellulose biosynthesis protein BcsQ
MSNDTMIITMANTKGGSAKTTVMPTLVGHAAHIGRPVTILDCDSSENASRWKELSLEAGMWWIQG